MCLDASLYSQHSSGTYERHDDRVGTLQAHEPHCVYYNSPFRYRRILKPLVGENAMNVEMGVQCASSRCILYSTVSHIEFDDSTRTQWDPISGEPVNDNAGLYRSRYIPVLAHPDGRNPTAQPPLMGEPLPSHSIVDSE